MLNTRVPEAPAQVHSSPTRPQVPGAGLPLLTGAQGGRLSRGNEGSGGEGRATTAIESSSSPRPSGLVLTPAREPRDRGGGGDPGQEKAGERGGERSPRSAQGEEWSTRAPEARRREAGSCVLWREGRGGRRRRGEEGGREVSAPGRSLQVSLVRSPGVRGCTELHGFLARPTPALSLCKNSPCWRRGHRDGGCGRRLPRGLPAPRGPAPTLPGCLRGLGRGHLRDRYEPGAAAREPPRLLRPSGGSRVPTPDCCQLPPAPRAAKTWSDLSTGMPRQLPPLGGGREGERVHEEWGRFLASQLPPGQTSPTF
ncbi:uncharacterized protein LOC144281724 [Canis aureus]